MTKNGDSLLKVLVRRAGPVKAARVASFLVVYGSLVMESGGERVSMERFADAWAVSIPTAYRRLHLFRELLPEFDHPYDLVMYSLEQRAAVKAGGVLDLPASILGVT